jgi:hypothetical protein
MGSTKFLDRPAEGVVDQSFPVVLDFNPSGLGQLVGDVVVHVDFKLDVGDFFFRDDFDHPEFFVFHGVPAFQRDTTMGGQQPAGQGLICFAPLADRALLVG